MTWEPGEFDDLAAELRRRVAAEFRSEAEEVEHLVELQRAESSPARYRDDRNDQGQRVKSAGAGTNGAGKCWRSEPTT